MDQNYRNCSLRQTHAKTLDGLYHQVGKRHLHRYLAEFDLRHNTRKEKDGDRTLMALDQVEGKRLMLRDSQSVN